MYGSHPECMLWADKPILRNHRNPRLHSAFILEQNIIAIRPICAKPSAGWTSILVSCLHCRLYFLKPCVCFRTCRNVSVILVKLEEKDRFPKKRLNLCMNLFILKEHVKLEKRYWTYAFQMYGHFVKSVFLEILVLTTWDYSRPFCKLNQPPWSWRNLFLDIICFCKNQMRTFNLFCKIHQHISGKISTIPVEFAKRKSWTWVVN